MALLKSWQKPGVRVITFFGGGELEEQSFAPGTFTIKLDEPFNGESYKGLGNDDVLDSSFVLVRSVWIHDRDDVVPKNVYPHFLTGTTYPSWDELESAVKDFPVAGNEGLMTLDLEERKFHAQGGDWAAFGLDGGLAILTIHLEGWEKEDVVCIADREEAIMAWQKCVDELRPIGYILLCVLVDFDTFEIVKYTIVTKDYGAGDTVESKATVQGIKGEGND